MPDLTLEIYERAVERAKTDERLAAGIRILERLNAQLWHAQAEVDRIARSYHEQEESIAAYMVEVESAK
jgi:hypothetical protein